MKQFLKKIIGKIIFLFSCVFSPKLFKVLEAKYHLVYSMWITVEFKRVGKNFYVMCPLYLQGGKYITIGDNFCCDQRLRLDAFDEFLGDKFTPEISIGNFVSIQKDCHIGAINKIVIGNNVLIASKVYISDHSHGEILDESIDLPPYLRKLYSKGAIIIEDNVWIGEGVSVLPNVTIGESSIIGANSVVTKSIPKNSVVVGNPARVIRNLR